MNTCRELAFLFALFTLIPNVNAADVGDLISGAFDARSRASRIEVARDLLTRVGRVADLIPTPRPSDVSWVETERAAIDKLSTEAASNRLLQFYRSPEFQNVKIYNALQQVKSAIGCVLESRVGLRREIICWATAGLYLGNRLTYTDGIDILHRSNRLPEAEVLNEAKLLYESFSRGIQEYLILPYLKGEIK